MSTLMAAGAPAVVLASGSAARRTLLASAGIAFSAVDPGVDEAAIKHRMRGQPATAVAMALAEAKACAAAAEGTLAIGADQILVQGSDHFDKPPHRAAARAQLLRLSGRSHQLVTAVACHAGGRIAWHHVATPVLRMRDLSAPFLDAYLEAEGDAVLGSVGAYRLEGPGLQLFATVEGEHSAVLGLPLLPLLGFLRAAGVILA